MLTREDYMKGRCTFEAYYAEVMRAAGIRAHIPKRFLKMCKEEYLGGNRRLISGDALTRRGRRYLTLTYWERVAKAILRYTNIHQVLKERGDYLTPAGAVCIAKQYVISKILEG